MTWIVRIPGMPGVNFLNLRGDQRPEASFVSKVLRVSIVLCQADSLCRDSQAGNLSHLVEQQIRVLRSNFADALLQALGKKIVLTAHNVNAGRRDSKDTRLNRLTLRIQYRLADHIFVHTEIMKRELIEEFGEQEARVTVIPFGINNAVPKTHLTSGDARRRLGIREGERTILFFGKIAPYKGLEYLVSAFRQILKPARRLSADNRRQTQELRELLERNEGGPRRGCSEGTSVAEGGIHSR